MVVNDLFKRIAYRPLWCDLSTGKYRSEPYQDPKTKTPKWYFDVSDEQVQVVGRDRTRSVDEHSRTDYWVFVQEGMDTLATEDAGQYTVDHSEGSLFPNKDVQYLQVADQTALVVEGDRIVAEAEQYKTLIEITTAPFPILDHLDTVGYNDPEAGGALLCLPAWWRIPFDGSAPDVSLEVLPWEPAEELM